jgi:hypothetical protein
MKKLLIAALALLPFAVSAADLSTKANPFGVAYPTTKCGMYYGIGTGGFAAPVNGAVVGEQIVGAELDAILGYTCPIGATGFWFAEGSIGVNNLHGGINTFAASGPLVTIERVGAGSPINALINPFGNTLSVPSLPLLPAGVTAGAALPYLFAGSVQQQLDVASSKQWLIAPLLGAGFIYRLSNGSVADVWAGWQLNSQAICTFGVCARTGNGGRVGVAFKF